MSFDPQSSEELVKRVSVGDRAALESLLARLLPDLDQFLRKRAGNLILEKESSADLAQSVCREMLERLADERFEYRSEAEFKQWLYRAAELKLKNRQRFYRRDRRSPLHEVRGDGASLAERLARSFQSPSQAAVKSEEIERLERAFEQLDERSREVIQLFHIDDRSHAEIAEQLGIEVAHSRTLLARAMARLARYAS